jgi:histidyl-tRNA synthetase
MNIPRVKGTQDFLDLTLYNYIIDVARDHLQTYHFIEIGTPILESTELFRRSLGLQTDVVTKEMFIIEQRDGKDVQDTICLRPEITASIVRAFVENGVAQTPWKVFNYGPVFRYERPQKGRYRQFHQLSIEIVGSNSVAQDAQFIKMLDRLLHEKLQLNSYALLVNFLGCPADRVAYRSTLKKFLDSIGDGLCDLCKDRKEKNIMRVFDCKNGDCQKLYADAPYLVESLCALCAQEWQQLQEHLEELSVSFTYCPTLVRGLDYYNKTVFEFSSNALGAQSAFCGGGRYDQLVTELGGKQDQPSVGAAFGLERLMLLLEMNKDILPLAQPPALHVIMPMSAKQNSLALMVGDVLLAAGLCTEIMLEGDSVKSMMRKANKLGAQICLLLGDEEQQANQVTVKNMVTGEQVCIAQSELLSYLKK